MPPTICQDGAWDFFKIDDKLGGEGYKQTFRGVEGVAKNFHICQLLQLSPSPCQQCKRDLTHCNLHILQALPVIKK